MARLLARPFRRDRDRDRKRTAGLQLTPVRRSTPDLSRPAPTRTGTPDLVGDLGSRLDAARARLRDEIPPRSE